MIWRSEASSERGFRRGKRVLQKGSSRKEFTEGLAGTQAGKVFREEGAGWVEESQTHPPRRGALLPNAYIGGMGRSFLTSADCEIKKINGRSSRQSTHKQPLT